MAATMKSAISAACSPHQDLSAAALIHDPRSCTQITLEGLPQEWRGSVRTQGAFAEHTRHAADAFLAALIFIVALPLSLLIAIAIKWDSPGPVFYRQPRVGLNGHVFAIWKFRSMRVDAEHQGPTWAAQCDDRVTRVGRVLRFTRLDEVPQVLNVLCGSMSLVGPRPERPVFVQKLEEAIPHFSERLLVKPGITGWAQVNYPYGASVEDARAKLSYDLYYIQYRSLLLDLRILLRTVGVVLFGQGAR